MKTVSCKLEQARAERLRPQQPSAGTCRITNRSEEQRATHRPTGRTLRFGEVAASAASIRLTSEPTPKPPDQWSLLGKASPSKLTNRLVVQWERHLRYRRAASRHAVRGADAIGQCWRQAETQRIPKPSKQCPACVV